MDVRYAHSGLEIIPREESLRLLAGQKVGRLVFHAGDQPMVLPVNFAVDRGVVVLRTGEGMKFDAILRQKVAFEVDDIDVVTGSGWSVVVLGRADEIIDDDGWFDVSGCRPDVPKWVPGPAEHWVRIRPTAISGRRLPLRPAS